MALCSSKIVRIFATEKPPLVMAKLNIIRPPKVNIETRKTFWKQLGMLILGTTISLVLTITAAVLMEKHQRAKDRKLTTLATLDARLDSLKIIKN